jgi:hypothetical protein
LPVVIEVIIGRMAFGQRSDAAFQCFGNLRLEVLPSQGPTAIRGLAQTSPAGTRQLHLAHLTPFLHFRFVRGVKNLGIEFQQENGARLTVDPQRKAAAGGDRRVGFYLSNL